MKMREPSIGIESFIEITGCVCRDCIHWADYSLKHNSALAECAWVCGKMFQDGRIKLWCGNYEKPDSSQAPVEIMTESKIQEIEKKEGE